MSLDPSKVGEGKLLGKARPCVRCSTAGVVTAFDERRQAATFEVSVRACHRSHRLMHQQIDFPTEDTTFNCHVLTVAAGLMRSVFLKLAVPPGSTCPS